MEDINNNLENNEQENQDKSKNAAREEIISWVKWILSAFIITFILRTFVFQMAIVNQISMQPTLIEGQMLVISKINYIVGSPDRGDIIVFKDESQNKLLIKRIIGLPGEELEISNGRVIIDNQALEPDYTAVETGSYGQNKWMVPPGSYFVMGDNRPHSRDSRADTVGFVEKKSVVGRAVFRIWPLKLFGTIK